MIAPKPNNPPTTLAELYHRETGATAGEKEIREILLSLRPDRRKVVSLYLKGYSWQQIAEAMSVGREQVYRKTSMQSRLRFAMRKVYRKLTGDKDKWRRDYSAWHAKRKREGK